MCACVRMCVCVCVRASVFPLENVSKGKTSAFALKLIKTPGSPRFALTER